MKFRSINNWDNVEEKIGLLFFSQLIEELTYETTLSTFKPSTMNVSLLCWEAERTLDAIESGTIRAPNLDHVLEELCENLERDPCVPRILNIPLKVVFATLKNKKLPQKERRLAVEVVRFQLDPDSYRNSCEEIIKENLGEDADLNELRSTTRNYVTTLLASGFSFRHIRETSIAHFNSNENRIDDALLAADGFFDRFRADISEYTVIFNVDPIFQSVRDVFKDINVDVFRGVPDDVNATLLPNFFKSGDKKTFSVISGVKSRDFYSARNAGERMLHICATFLNLFHHRQRPAWGSDAAVYAGDGRASIISSTNPMHKGSDLKPTVAARKLKLFMEHFSLDQEAFRKFMRSAQLHGLAVGSNSIENQMLNIWIALESLIPSETKGEEDASIEHIVNSLIPLLNYNYIEAIANSLVKDMLHWRKKVVYEALKEVPGRSFTERLLRLLAVDRFKEKKEKLIAKCDQFVLMKYRINFLSNIFCDRKKCSEFIKGHEKRVAWQIRRIYRARNIIVHSGITPPETKQLIENAHEYLDRVFNVLIQLASHPRQISSVSQCFKLADMHYQSYLSALVDDSKVIDESNIHGVFFMRNPLRS